MIITTIVLAANIVSFKDADKIKSWDAWDDHKAKSVITEIHDKRECVTWKKLNKLDPGLKEIGRLARRESKDIKGSKWSIGCETMDRDYAVVLEKLKKENALDLASYFIYHPYADNPDTSYEAGEGQFGWQMALPLRRLVKSYNASFDIIQGEVGCPSQLEFAHALSGKEWTEYSQAKWLLRRAVGDAVRSIPSSIFTMIDLKYTFMLQSFGLVRSNLLKEFVYRRPSYYAMSNVFNLLDDDAKPMDVETRKCGSREITRARFARGNEELSFFWFSDAMPSNELVFEKVDLQAAFGLDGAATWTEMITGRVFELGDVKSVPLWDSPVLIRR